MKKWIIGAVLGGLLFTGGVAKAEFTPVTTSINKGQAYGRDITFFSSWTFATASVFNESGSTTVGSGAVDISDVIGQDGLQRKHFNIDMESFAPEGTLTVSVYGGFGSPTNWVMLAQSDYGPNSTGNDANNAGTATFFLDSTDAADLDKYVEKLCVNGSSSVGATGTITATIDCNIVAPKVR